MAPVVEKTLVAGIAIAYVASMLGLLLGGVVPGYQAATGEELAERTVATAGGEIETAVPHADGHVDARTTVDLPATIQNAGYWLELSDGTLTLHQPDSGVQEQVTLSLPPGTTVQQSRWESGGDLSVRVSGPASNRTVRIGGDP